MARAEVRVTADSASRVIDSLRDAEESALEAARKFLDTVDSIFPALSEDGPRRKIIDSAFKMTEQLVGTSNQLAQRIVKATSEALAQPKMASARRAAGARTLPRKTAAQTVAAPKTPARTAPARQTAARKPPARKTAVKQA